MSRSPAPVARSCTSGTRPGRRCTPGGRGTRGLSRASDLRARPRPGLASNPDIGDAWEVSTTTLPDAGSLRGFPHGLPGVDQVGADERAARLATRSIKTSAKARAIDLAISMLDL